MGEEVTEVEGPCWGIEKNRGCRDGEEGEMGGEGTASQRRGSLVVWVWCGGGGGGGVVVHLVFANWLGWEPNGGGKLGREERGAKKKK